jgi:hypothetical protein
LLNNFLTTVRALEHQKQARKQLLENLLNSPAPNLMAIGQVVLQIHALDQQQAAAVDSFHKAFLSLLTPQQLESTQAVVQAAQLAPVVNAFAALYLVAPPAPAQNP